MITMTKRARWAVPVGVGAVIAGVIAGPSLIASATANLPELTAEELMTKVAEADPAALSGTVVYTARLGLPELPMDTHGPAGPVNLLAGSSTIRVATDGKDSARATITGPMSEYSVVHSGKDTWTYSSDENKAVHYTLSPEAEAQHEAATPGAKPEDGSVPTPQAAAKEILASTSQFTDYSVDSATRVAGRDAYQLGLVPKTNGTLVDRVLIAVDAKTFTPLRVQMWGQDTKAPAVELAFTDVSFSAPDPATFTFTAPQGATVEESTFGNPADDSGAAKDQATPEAPEVLGTGWESVLVLKNVDLQSLLDGTDSATSDPSTSPSPTSGEGQLLSEIESSKGDSDQSFSLSAAAVLSGLATKVDGGYAISSALLSVLITDDGRVLVGAVPVDTLVGLAG